MARAPHATARACRKPEGQIDTVMVAILFVITLAVRAPCRNFDARATVRAQCKHQLARWYLAPTV